MHRQDGSTSLHRQLCAELLSQELGLCFATAEEDAKDRLHSADGSFQLVTVCEGLIDGFC